MPDEFLGAITKHALGGRVHGFDHAAVRMQRNDAVYHGIQHGLDQRRIVAQGLLHRVFFGHIAKHQYRADHLAIAVANRRATVGNGALATVGTNQSSVVGEALYRALRQGFQDRYWRGLARLLG